MKVRYQRISKIVTVVVTLLFVLSVNVVYADGGADRDHRDQATYRITVENLTQTQPFSPLVAATHHKHLTLFKRGDWASDELEAIAENGDNGPMLALLNASHKVTDVFGDGALLLPGASISFELSADKNDRLTLAGMLVCTNDGFNGLNGRNLPNQGTKTYYLNTFDAGTEENTELASDVPCLPGGNENDAVDTDQRIRRHRGIQEVGDLTQAEHGWTDPVAKVVVERLDNQGKIVIANRASGTISVIDAGTDEVIDTITLPGDNTPEPMYAMYVKKNHQVFVGDRANNQVVAFNADDFSVAGTVPAGNGVFHMWAHNKKPQLWVNNDVDNTITVINPNKLEVITTVPLPADLVALGGKPHDVILDQDAAYVTMLGFPGENDYLIKYDRSTFQEVARAPVGKDPHVILTQKTELLYVAAQNSNSVTVFERSDLSEVITIDVPGAHGVWIPRSGKVLYATNLPGGSLVTIDLDTNTVIGDAVDTDFPIPHNVVATRNNRKLYVTHSGGTADQVTVYTISRNNPLPVPLRSITVGLNPFGLTFVPAE